MACREFNQTRWRRRQILQAGVAGFSGLSLPTLWSANANAHQRHGGFGSAKRCIFLLMWGGPSQLDTFDLKPNAPPEIRGEFRPISTNVPGFQICEHFQRLAGHADKLTLIRSLHHDDPAHLSSGHTTVTGQLPPVNKSDAEPPSEKDTPHLGCVMSKLRPAPSVLPSFVMLPWKVAHPAAPGGQAPGQHGGFMGREHDPFVITGDPNAAGWRVPSLSLSDGISVERMANRQQLLRDLDQVRTKIESDVVQQATHLEQRAFELLGSPKVREAFDLSKEAPAVRERYGRNIHGQCVLLARRLVEHGVPIVTVNWHNDGRNFWDTHGDNFNRLKNDLIPPADRALSSLLEDLQQRNMLDDTLVVWVGEFGRRPLITPGNAGREHWPHCYSGLLAGGGIQGGVVYGQSDRHAAHPTESPVSPHQLVATIYHAMGVSQDAVLQDTLNRPRPIYAAEPLRELFA